MLTNLATRTSDVPAGVRFGSPESSANNESAPAEMRFGSPETLAKNETEKLFPTGTIDYDVIVQTTVNDCFSLNLADLASQNKDWIEKYARNIISENGNTPPAFFKSWEDVKTTDSETGEEIYEVNGGKDENKKRTPEQVLLNQHPLPADATIVVHYPNGVTVQYKTDSKGRVVSASVKELKVVSKEEQQRYSYETGKTKDVKDGNEKDDGGHLIGNQFGGGSEQINLVPMDSEVNRRGAFSKVESTVRNALNEGKSVTNYTVEPIYEGDSARPSAFKVSYEIDGKPYTTIIFNE